MSTEDLATSSDAFVNQAEQAAHPAESTHVEPSPSPVSALAPRDTIPLGAPALSPTLTSPAGAARPMTPSALVGRGSTAEPIDRAGRLTLDRLGHAARLDGSYIKLTAREFRLLVFLYEHRGQAISRDVVLQQVWGSAYHGGRRTVDVHVRRLRAKLREHLPLETLRGVGYKLRDEVSPDAPIPQLT